MQADKPGTIAAAVMLSVIGVFGLIPQPLFLGALQDYLEFTNQQASLITASEIIGGALASLLAVFWINRLNWRIAAMFAIAVVVIGNVLTTFQTSFAGFATIRFLVGFLGNGTAFAIAISIISSSSDTERNFAYSIAAQVAFGVVSFAVLPYAIVQWQIAGILGPLGILALLTLLVIRWIPTSSTRDSGTSSAAGGSVGLPLFALGALLIWCLGLGGIYAFEERIGVAAGLEKTSVGTALAAAVAIGFLGAMTASWVADRWGRLLPVSVALGAQIAAIMLLQGEMSWVRFAMIAGFFHFFWNFTGPYMMGAVASSDQTGRISVLMPAAQTGGFAVGTALAGNMMTGSALTPANYVAAAGCLAALLVFVPVALRLARQPQTAAE
jgi:predicted MFS family arabinose efflux permease